jgi:opacity protein-like surface antigen
MTSKLFRLALLSAATLFAGQVSAQEAKSQDQTKGAYVTVGVGGNWASDPSISYSESGRIGSLNYTETTNGNVDLGGGVSVSAGVGYDFGNNLRAELSYTYNALSIGSTTGTDTLSIAGGSFTGIGSISTSGTASTNSVLVSGYYDIPTKSKWTPYVGGGIGWTSVSFPGQNVTASGCVSGFCGSLPVFIPGGSGNAFGYQAKLGVSYLTSKRSDLFVEGIYQGNTSVTINNTSIGALNDFGVRAGVRYRFGN